MAPALPPSLEARPAALRAAAARKPMQKYWESGEAAAPSANVGFFGADDRWRTLL